MLTYYFIGMGPVKVPSTSDLENKFETQRRKERSKIMASIFGWKNEGGDGVVLGGDLINARERVLQDSGCDFFTIRMKFDNSPSRPRGEYCFKSATAKLDWPENAKSLGEYELGIKFVAIQDAKELHDLIRSGKVWPVVNYGDPQVPAPCRHLKDLFREAIGIIRREFARKLHFA